MICHICKHNEMGVGEPKTYKVCVGCYSKGYRAGVATGKGSE